MFTHSIISNKAYGLMIPEISTRWLTLEDCRNKTISYAQNHEDVLLLRVFGRNLKGVYVDVGANDPVFHSVTKLLYDQGWRGINIEPSPILHQKLVGERPGDINLNVGASDKNDTLTFYEVAPPLHGWSTFMPDIAAAYQSQGVATTERKIPVVTLETLFEKYLQIGSIDVLKIDVEGHERQVLLGINLDKWQPKVIIVEAASIDQWESIIIKQNYSFKAFDGLNNYYVSNTCQNLMSSFEAPVNILDNFIPYEYLRLLESYQTDFGPYILKFAHSMSKFTRKYPRLAVMIKRILKFTMKT